MAPPMMQLMTEPLVKSTVKALYQRTPKLNVNVSVENTPEGTLLQNEVQVKVDV